MEENKIKLIQFLNTYDFDYFKHLENKDVVLCDTVKIYYDYNKYFEFGINHYYSCDDFNMLDDIKLILSEEILNKEIDAMQLTEEDIGDGLEYCVCVYLDGAGYEK